MTRKEQITINKSVESALESVFDSMHNSRVMHAGCLHHCKAWVYETPDWYILESYNTIVAAVNKNTSIGYDFLRFVYGYTATSAQHIGKFFHDYGVRCVGGSGLEMRWYPC